MSKLDQLRALREVRSPRGSPANPGQDVARQDEHRSRKGPQAERAPVTNPARERVPKRGRPRIEDRAKTLQATKPWVAAGMSERTWYRRRAERAKQ